jgi:hypothetical protein
LPRIIRGNLIFLAFFFDFIGKFTLTDVSIPDFSAANSDVQRTKFGDAAIGSAPPENLTGTYISP